VTRLHHRWKAEAELSMPQSSSPDIKQLSGGHRAINTAVNPVVLRLFGCGIYDWMFEN